MPDHNYVIREEESGSVHIAEDVLAAITGETVRGVEGVGGFATSFGGELAERLSKKSHPSRGVKISIEENEISVDVFVLVQYGSVIAEVATAVQEAVTADIEAMTGIKTKAVNVTICGIAFEKAK